MIRRASLVALLAFVMTVAAAAAPEHDRLKAMVGTWDVEMTLWPRGHAQRRAVHDARVDRVQYVDAPVRGQTRIASTNTARVAETGVYDEKAGQLELKADYPLAGDTWHQRTVIQQTSADTMTAASYLSFGSVPEWKGVEIKYTRRK